MKKTLTNREENCKSWIAPPGLIAVPIVFLALLIFSLQGRAQTDAIDFLLGLQL